MAVAASLVLFVLLLPWFSGLTGRALAAGDLAQSRVLWLFGGAVLLTGLVAGLYPVFRLTRFEAVRVLKGERQAGGRGLRRVLVTAQFALSAAVIIATLLIQDQLEFLQTRSPGYAVSDLVSIRLRGETMNDWRGIKEDVLSLPGVRHASGASGTPLEAMITMSGEEGEEPFRLYHFSGDEDYLSTLDLTLVRGEGLRAQSRAAVR